MSGSKEMFIAFLILDLFSSAHTQTLHSRRGQALHFQDSSEPVPCGFHCTERLSPLSPSSPNPAIL